MKEVKDPEIRLFGRKIVLPESGGGGEPSAESCGSGGGGVECDRDLDSSGVVEEGGDDGNRIHREEVQVLELCNSVEESLNPTKSDSDENPKSSSTVEGGMSDNQAKAETEQIDAANGQQKALKKPDKVLPCPRCNSMDTKFCYYNNYNVNQPRYFCKSCQRYWTEGGTMRNVPVGAGRRKNKTPTSHCRHITVSDALQPARIDAVNGLHHPAFKPNGATHVNRNRHPEVDHGDDCSIASSVITTNSSADGSKIRAQMQSMNVFPSPFPALPGAPWPVPWNSALAIPAIYPIPFCPPPYWSCSLPNAWNAAWPSFQEPTAANPSSSLGKHARNGELLKTTCSASKENLGNSIVIPKTLRIDDPEEAAKSSIWETLGIKYDSSSREGLFKALQPKGDQKKPPISPSPAFQANPAALSRSISFQEQA